jgi:membrane protein
MPTTPASATSRRGREKGSVPQVVFQAASSFVSDDALTLCAALSFYTLLSFAPLLVLAVWASGSMAPGAQEAMLDQFGALAGNDARLAAQAVVDSASERPALGSLAGLLGIGTSLVGATTVFAQLQASLNTLWGIEAKPHNAVWGWLRRRVLSIGVIAAIGFVLIVSLLVSSVLGLLLTHTGPVWDVLNQAISVVVFAGLFALLFRYLPDARLPWRPAAWGGLVTAILFGIGKWVIGLYLARGEVGGAYGAAGSVVVLLVWVYYSSAIFFFGAELVQAWLVAHGGSIAPAAHAVRKR